MALPFLNGATKKTREQMLAIDLGGRTTKAVFLQQSQAGLVLSRYVLLDAPIYERNLSAELLTEHLKAVCTALDIKTRLATIAVGVNEAIARHADMPQMPVGDLRLVLRNNTKNYLQQDLPGHIFDCYIIPPRAVSPKAGEKGKQPASSGAPKARVLVAGAKRQLLDDMQLAVRAAGLVPDHIVPGVIGPVNAFERAMPEVFSKDVVALVDIGFKSSSICILLEGDLVLSRVVAIGGDRLTNGLAESMGVSYAEAEGIKVGMPMEVQSNLETLILPLGRELRASIDFFEHHNDRTVTQIFIGGASARSELVLQTLQAELMLECKPWNPLSSLQLALPPQQMAEVEHVAPQLAVAIGAALAAM